MPADWSKDPKKANRMAPRSMCSRVNDNQSQYALYAHEIHHYKQSEWHRVVAED